MKVAFEIDNARLAAFCTRWHIREIDLFGSVLRSDFRPDSDVDILVTYEPDAKITLFDEARIEEELGALFGRSVDMISRRAVEESSNWIRRKAILESAEPLYVAS